MSSSAVFDSRLPSSLALDAAVGMMCGGMAFSVAPAVVGVVASAAPEQGKASEKVDRRFDVWASLQSLKEEAADPAPAPYVHPLVRRSARFMSKTSLEVCTESLGSETGSDGTFSSDYMENYFSTWKSGADEEVVEMKKPVADDDHVVAARHHEEMIFEVAQVTAAPPSGRKKQLASVNYHCSMGKKSPSRSFPPPLPSISRRDGPCLSMRRYRRDDGHLVVEAVPAPSQNYLHAERQGGRLILTFIETTIHDIYHKNVEVPEEGGDAKGEASLLESVGEDYADDTVVDDEDEAEAEEGVEEVEVVDKGIVVEVNVSRPPLPQNGGLKVQRSSVVINKFVGMPSWPAGPPGRQIIALDGSTTTTATAVVAVAAVAFSSLSTDGPPHWRKAKGPPSAQRQPSPEKLYFTSKALNNKQDLLTQVRRCGEHHRPLFIWEPCCIVTS